MREAELAPKANNGGSSHGIARGLGPLAACSPRSRKQPQLRPSEVAFLSIRCQRRALLPSVRPLHMSLLPRVSPLSRQPHSPVGNEKSTSDQSKKKSRTLLPQVLGWCTVLSSKGRIERARITGGLRSCPRMRSPVSLYRDSPSTWRLNGVRMPCCSSSIAALAHQASFSSFPCFL